MATHSSIPAWRIPWTEEPGGLSPLGYTEVDMTEEFSMEEPQNKMEQYYLFLPTGGRDAFFESFAQLENLTLREE